MTIMTTTFVPCGAKLPIIAPHRGRDVPGKFWWLAPCAYFLGIGMVIVRYHPENQTVRGRTGSLRDGASPVSGTARQGVLIHMWERGKSFIIKAGTIIFASTVVIWLLSNFNTRLKWWIRAKYAGGNRQCHRPSLCTA